MVRFEHVSKVYRTRNGEVRSLDGIDLQIQPGEFVVVRGPSGSGKTTLLLTAGGMLHPSAGKVWFDGTDLYAMDVKARARVRATRLGFVFQMFHLVPYLDVLDNVRLAATRSSGDATDRAVELLRRFGLEARLHHRPAELSAGERQRVALARAMINHPDLILADEPTGNLDPDNAAEVFRRLQDFHREGGTVLLVTHGAMADQFADRVIHLRDGKIVKANGHA